METSRRKPQPRRVEGSTLLFASGVKTSRSAYDCIPKQLGLANSRDFGRFLLPPASSGRAAAAGSLEGSGPETIVSQIKPI
jgi:hypothetical protein